MGGRGGQGGRFTGGRGGRGGGGLFLNVLVIYFPSFPSKLSLGSIVLVDNLRLCEIFKAKNTNIIKAIAIPYAYFDESPDISIGDLP